MDPYKRVISDSRVTVKGIGRGAEGLYLRLYIFTPISSHPEVYWSYALKTKTAPPIHQGEKEAAFAFDLKCKEHDLKPINRYEDVSDG